MRLTRLGSSLLLGIVTLYFSNSASAQDSKVDFARDVLPLFRAHCFDCHGPKQQKGGFRLDRREDAMKGGTITVIGPGNAEGSRLYHTLSSDKYGPQMPPDGPLTAAEIKTIKLWIDQGAQWPDEHAGQKPKTTPDAGATRMMDALREGDRQTFEAMLKDEPAIAKLKGPGGSTPLMYAVLYADAATMRELIKAGADVNSVNDAGATALMWAVGDVERMNILIKAGADVNVKSEDGRTALLIASGRSNAGPLVKLLLEHGANPSVTVPSYRGPINALRQAADRGDADTMAALIKAGAKLDSAGPLTFISAVNSGNPGCADVLLKAGAPAPVPMSLLFVSPPFAHGSTLSDPATVKLLIGRGADVNAKDPAGRTVLMLAAHLDTLPAASVQALIDAGADVNAKATDGRTALDFALLRGRSPVTDVLLTAGPKEGVAAIKPEITPKTAATVGVALERSLPLLQRVDVKFVQTTGCVSCHHNTLTAMAVREARDAGFRVDSAIAREQSKLSASFLENWRERTLQDSPIPGDVTTISHMLMGMAAQNVSADASTDAMARFLLTRQQTDGRFRPIAHRPPMEAGDIAVTAATIRSLKVYAPKTRRAETDKAIERAAAWLKTAEVRSIDDRAYRILGLHWAGADADVIRNAARDLLARQHADGGWSQLPDMASDAYATGQALVALKAAGITGRDPAVARGVKYLLNTQLEDGSWYVRSRAIGFQPYFESGFPHGHDPWISAAATGWAVMGLAGASR